MNSLLEMKHGLNTRGQMEIGSLKRKRKQKINVDMEDRRKEREKKEGRD